MSTSVYCTWRRLILRSCGFQHFFQWGASIIHLVWIGTLIIALTEPMAAQAEPFEPDQLKDSDVPWHISADRVTYDEQNSVYIAEGNVTIRKKNVRLTADSVRFDDVSKTAQATGNVILTDGGDILSGKRIDLDLNTETGTLFDGSVFIQKSHFYIKGSRIQKTGKETYSAENASVTACDGDEPDWKITAKKVKVTIEGYGSASHTVFWMKRMPTLYSPYMIFPVKTERQSGLLAPDFGLSSKSGIEYAQPLYWAINESSDATLYYQYLELRGHKLGGEYRYILSDRSKGTWMADGFEDDKVDDGEEDHSDKWGFEDKNAEILRPNSDRYWFRMKHDQALPFEFTAKLDLDVTSDQDYLREFKYGYMGFNQTNRYFEEKFGREVDPYDDRIRENSLTLSRIWGKYTFNAKGAWNDDVVARRQEDTDTTLQRLPLVEFTGTKHQLFSSPLYFSLDSGYTRFYRQDGKGAGVENITEAHRTDIWPRVYLPMRYRNYFTFEPSAGYRKTAWRISDFEAEPDDAETAFDRDLYDIKLDWFTKFYKIYNADINDIDRIRHTVQPQVVFDYIPYENQEDIPKFDKAIDRIAEKKQLTYSLINTMTSRSQPSPVPEDAFAPINPDYNQFFRFKLEQSYNFLEAEQDDDDGEKEPFSPLFGEIDITPKRYVTFDADANWDVYYSEFQNYNAGVTLRDEAGDKLTAEYRYARDSRRDNKEGLESIYLFGQLRISDRLSVNGVIERDIENEEAVKTGFGFLYSAQCWSIDAGYIHENDDTRISFVLNLKGLGEFGN